MKRNLIMSLGIILAIIISITLGIFYGNTKIKVSMYDIEDEKIPVSFEDYTIVQVSDLHNATFGKKQETLLGAIEQEKPDMVVITGDLIDSSSTDVENAMEFVEGAVKLAPVYYVTGNHEAAIDKYLELEKQLELAGVTILRNASVEIECEDYSIQLLGVDDPNFTKTDEMFDMSTGIMKNNLEEMDITDEYTILLSHRPELINIYSEYSIDLVLSGHAHGGQVIIPFIGGLVAPNQGFFPEYTEGIHEINNTKMIISRGLGNSIIPIRVNNLPELVVIKLHNQ